MLTSTDGADWQAQQSGTSSDLIAVAFANGNYVAFGSQTNLYASSNGTNWLAQNWVQIASVFRGLDAAGDRFFLLTDAALITISNSAGRATSIYNSDSGTNWSQSAYWSDWTQVDPFAASGFLRSSAYGVGRYVCVGGWTGPLGQGPIVITSIDRTNWTFARIDRLLGHTPVQFQKVIYGDGRFVAIGQAVGGSYIGYSDDGTNWTAVAKGFPDLTSIAFGEGIYVAVGPFGTLLVSPDGANWSRTDLGTTADLTGVTFGAGTFVAVGAEGQIWQSDPVIHLRVVGQDPLQLAIASKSGISCDIEIAGELAETNVWQRIATVQLTNGPTVWVDAQATNGAQRFYRAVLRP